MLWKLNDTDVLEDIESNPIRINPQKELSEKKEAALPAITVDAKTKESVQETCL